MPVLAMFLISIATLSCCFIVTCKAHPHIFQKISSKRGLESLHPPKRLYHETSDRLKRNTDHIITECMDMTSDEGHFYHKASEVDGTACGVYIFAEPDQRVELHFNYLDVPCENGGLVAFIDGWELNGQFFPSPEDHPKPMELRFSEFCGPKKIKQTFTSSQNVALIQYRMPIRSASFSFSVRFIKNPTPCNTLMQSTEDIFTLRNYGKRRNCSITSIFPAAIRVASLNVGIVSNTGHGVELETGTITKCQKRGLDDYVQIGGSAGLDNSGLLLADSICGIDSKAANEAEMIACGVTTIRLVSSGNFDNSVTIVARQLTEDDFAGHMSVICPFEK